MAIPELTPKKDSNGNKIPTAIQQTTLGLDLIARFVCNTWDEATADSEGIDVVVLGAGMYGGYCASKIFELSRKRFGGKALRVLVLEAGPFVVPEHTQNIPNLALYDPFGDGPLPVGSGTKPPTRKIVWGIGWRSNQPFVGQAYCVGGKGIYWGGWCPRLQNKDLENWPKEVRDFLTKVNQMKPVGTRPIKHREPFTNKVLKRNEPLSGYEALEYEIGVKPSDDFVFDPVKLSEENIEMAGLNEALFEFLNEKKAEIDNRIIEITPAPIAVQTQSYISGLFSLDKYSSVPALIASTRSDHSDGRTSNLRMAVVPFAHVVRLDCVASVESPQVGTRHIDSITAKVNGEFKHLKLGPHCQVVLAMSCIESTRLALESFSLESSLLKPKGQELMGRNFMIHVRSDIFFNVERSAFEKFLVAKGKSLAKFLQQASLHIQCEGQHGSYQYQLYAATNANGPDPNLYNLVPDLDIQSKIAMAFDAEIISLVLRSSGEVKGGRKAAYKDPEYDYIDLAGDADYDCEFDHRRAWVQFKTLNGKDHTSDLIWQEMHDTGHAIARAVAYGGELMYKEDFSLPRFSRQQGVGTTFHDSGTLWMGDDSSTSVTDVNGHFHHVSNAYCADQALFTTVGSANPVLTGLCLARKVAEDIVSRHDSYKAPDEELARFQPVSLSPGNGWLTAPYTGVYVIDDEIIEMQPSSGIGVYYLPLEKENFELHVEWKAFRSPGFPNSGILLRMPDPRTVDFNDQVQFDAFYDSSVEIQIDDLGKNFKSDRIPQAIFGDSLHKTGAIYGVAPATQWAGTVLAPDGNEASARYWNAYQIKIERNKIEIKLNGKQVSAADLPDSKNKRGFIGFQFHTGRVQFRNLKIRNL